MTRRSAANGASDPAPPVGPPAWACELLARLGRIEDLLLARSGAITPADRRVLRMLLPQLEERFAGQVFAAAEVAAFLPGRSAKSLGRLLARVEGVAIGDLRLERCAKLGGAWSWRVISMRSVVSGLLRGFKPA